MRHYTPIDVNAGTIAEDILQVRLKMLFGQGAIAIVTNLLLAVITAQVLSTVLDKTFLYFWLTLSLSVAIFRFVITSKLKNKLARVVEETVYSITQLRRYEAIYASGLAISGVLWGMLGLFIAPDWPVNQLLIIPLVAAGLSAGAISLHMSSLRCYYGFVLPMGVPICYGLYHAGHDLAGLTTAIYLVVMLILVKYVNAKLLETLGLKLKNTELIKHLTATNKQQTELLEKFEKNKVFLQHVFDDAGVPMLIIDKSYRIIDVNEAACRLSGYSKFELMSINALDFLHKDDRERGTANFNDLFAGKVDWYQSKKRFKNRAGDTLWLHSTVTAVKDDNQDIEYAIVQSQNVTEEFKLNYKLTYQASHDELTGLPNRFAFENELNHLLQQQSDDSHVLCYIDLDQFKVVNDTCGHSAGDELLRQTAIVLKQGLRRSDFLARIGGDEFAVVVFNCTLEKAIEQFEHLMSKLREFRFAFDNQLFKITASLGVVSINEGDTLTTVLMEADNACYAAKDAGRDRLQIFSQDDEILSQRKGMMQWVSRVQRAIAENDLVLYQQNIVRTENNDNVPHYELLIRMKDDQGKIIAPGQFLPAVEHYGMAAEIDLWVVENVINRLETARLAGRDISGVYGINLSGQSLGDVRFYEDIIKHIGDNDLIKSNAHICFEITETAAISNISAALEFITRLKAVGCQFALDDFGSGLSSFAYLKQLPIDYLKIDGMFVKDCLNDPVNLEMIKSINGIGHVMGLKTIAEYVENDQIFDTLAEIGVDYAQGFWNGPPQPWAI